MRKAIRVWKSIAGFGDSYLAPEVSVIEYHVSDSLLKDKTDDLG